MNDDAWQVENKPEDEIRRLRKLIAQMERDSGRRGISVEIVQREGMPGYCVYVCAPTATDEKELGLRLFRAVAQGFSIHGLKTDVKPAFVEELPTPPEGKDE